MVVGGQRSCERDRCLAEIAQGELAPSGPYSRFVSKASSNSGRAGGRRHLGCGGTAACDCYLSVHIYFGEPAQRQDLPERVT